jgi:hypothetical protein
MDDDSDSDAQAGPPHLTVVDGGAGKTKAKAKAKGQRKRPPLTAKQERFLAEMIKGSTQADAFRSAYNCGRWKPSAIYTEAGRLMAHPEIHRRLLAHQTSVERSAASNALSRRRFVLEGLEAVASGATSESAKVAALIALGKTQGVDLFTDKVEVDDARSVSEVRDELERRLQVLLTGTG